MLTSACRFDPFSRFVASCGRSPDSGGTLVSEPSETSNTTRHCMPFCVTGDTRRIVPRGCSPATSRLLKTKREFGPVGVRSARAASYVEGKLGSAGHFGIAALGFTGAFFICASAGATANIHSAATNSVLPTQISCIASTMSNNDAERGLSPSGASALPSPGSSYATARRGDLPVNIRHVYEGRMPLGAATASLLQSIRSKHRAPNGVAEFTHTADARRDTQGEE